MREATPSYRILTPVTILHLKSAISVEQPWFLATCDLRGEARNLELAKGFEPPTG